MSTLAVAIRTRTRHELLAQLSRGTRCEPACFGSASLVAMTVIVRVLPMAALPNTPFPPLLAAISHEMTSTATVALAITGIFPSRLVVTLLVHLNTSFVHPLESALVPVTIALASFVCALALAQVVLAFASVLAIGTVPGYVTVSFARHTVKTLNSLRQLA